MPVKRNPQNQIHPDDKTKRPRKPKQIVAADNLTDNPVDNPTGIISAPQKKPKQHRNRPDLAKFGEEYTEPGDNARYLRFARVSMSLPPIDISDPKQVEYRINQYFDFCEQNDRKPNMIGMANWIGVDRSTVNTWKNGEYRNSTHSPVIKKALDILEELWVDYMQNGKINPASGIFLAKNLFQYRNEHKVIVTPQDPLANQNADELRNYLKSLPEIAEDSNE